ncbi:MAG: hypothetical protein U9Q68_04430 [Euryarchaeota archaeon]|nr:hypothetical protein [Euryarchaeota archaeon]
MIITYSWLDQYSVLGLGSYPAYFGTMEFVLATPATCRTTTISAETRRGTISAETRRGTISAETRTVTMTC